MVYGFSERGVGEPTACRCAYGNSAELATTRAGTRGIRRWREAAVFRVQRVCGYFRRIKKYEENENKSNNVRNVETGNV